MARSTVRLTVVALAGLAAASGWLAAGGWQVLLPSGQTAEQSQPAADAHVAVGSGDAGHRHQPEPVPVLEELLRLETPTGEESARQEELDDWFREKEERQVIRLYFPGPWRCDLHSDDLQTRTLIPVEMNAMSVVDGVETCVGSIWWVPKYGRQEIRTADTTLPGRGGLPPWSSGL